MKVPEDENYSDYEDTTDNRFPVESAQSLKAKLRRMEASVLQLDAENQRLKEQNKCLETKVNSSERKRKTTAEINKMKRRYIKKWATLLPKLAAAKTTKFTGCSKEIVIERIGFDEDDFEAIFGGKGYLVQPRSNSKPKSFVIIRRFSWSEIQKMFRGDGFALKKTLTVSIWANENYRTFYRGPGRAKIAGLDVVYNKSQNMLSLKFQCERQHSSMYESW